MARRKSKKQRRLRDQRHPEHILPRAFLERFQDGRFKTADGEVLIELKGSTLLIGKPTVDLPDDPTTERALRSYMDQFWHRFSAEQKLRLDELQAEAVAFLEKAPRSIDYSGILSRVAQGFDLLQLVVPKRIADEEIGDALELIDRLARERRPKWRIYLKAASAVFFVLLNAIREVSSSLLGKKNKA
jgi:hypothetical protein